MARLRSPEKREAILQAAILEIAETGLSAPTAKIAQRAGVAAGTLFTYFATKQELLNELYFETKSEIYERINVGFPRQGSLKRRTRHVWSSFLAWGIEFPEKRKVSLQLNVSGIISPATRARTAAASASIDATLAELGVRAESLGLPCEFAAAMLLAMQEATLEFVAQSPRHRAEWIENAFLVFWRAFR